MHTATASISSTDNKVAILNNLEINQAFQFTKNKTTPERDNQLLIVRRGSMILEGARA